MVYCDLCLQLYLPISDWLSDDECETADKSSMRAKQGQEFSEECILANTVDWDTGQQTVVSLVWKTNIYGKHKNPIQSSHDSEGSIFSEAILPIFRLYIVSHRVLCRIKMLPVVILAKYYSAVGCFGAPPTRARDSFVSVQYYNLDRLIL